MRRPSGDQRGSDPPVSEIRHRDAGPGNARTNTSSFPLSSDTYTSHLPSGDNAGANSPAADVSNGFDTVSLPTSERYAMSIAPFGPVAATMVRPSRDNE